MDAKLSVEVGAKIDQLLTEMAKAEQVVVKSVAGMEVAVNKADRSFKLLNQTKFTFGSNFQTASSKLATEAARTSAVFGGFSRGANQANSAVLELSRGIQDAPYGSMGYINNLQQFQQLFQQLVTQTGSFKGAIKSLGQSLIGPAGIGVAFSVITAAITVYSMWQQKSEREAGKATKTNEDYADSLNQVAQAQLKGAKAAQEDLITLQLLYKRTQDITLGVKERTKASDELQAKWPTYFKSFTDEAILAGAAAGKYNELTNAILASGRARAAVDLIVKNQSRKLEDEQKILDLQKEGTVLLEREASLRERIKNAQGNAVIGLARDLATVEGEIADNRALQRNIASDIYAIDQKNLQLTKSVNQEIAKGGSLTGPIGGKEAKGGIKKTKAELIKELRDLGIQIELETKGLLIKVNKFEEDLFEKRVKANGQIGTKPLITMDSILEKNMSKNVAQELKLINFELIAFNDSASQIINDSIANTFDGIGIAIGNALSGSENLIVGLSHTLLSSLGGVLVDLGKLAIATGVGIQAIKTALKTLNPVVAIAAGVGLIALGSAITKSVSKLGEKPPGFATGVHNFGGGVALVGERGPELVNLPQGSDVIPNHRTRGLMGDSGGFIAETRVGIDALYIALMREHKKRLSLG